MRLRKGLNLLLIGCLMLAVSQFQVDAARRQVLILDIPRFELAAISERYPNFYKLVENSSVGIMTTPLSEPLTFDKVYLGLNSGSQVKTNPDSYSVVNASEEVKKQRAGIFYQNLTGIAVQPESAIYLELPRLTLNNIENVRANLGLMGKLLHQKGIHTAAIGNADADIKNRLAATSVMDQNGVIDWGAVGPETLMDDPLFPSGLRTHADQVISYWGNFNKKAQVIIITLGDLERIDRYSAFLSKERWNYYRQDALRSYDRLIGELLAKIDFQHTLLVVFSALPPEKEQTLGSRLTPVMIKGADFGTGLLYSRSTRKIGIITNYDLPVTILNFFHIDTLGFYNGFHLSVRPGRWQTIIREQTGLIVNYDLRWPLLTTYGYLLIGLFLVLILGMIFSFKDRLMRRLQWSYLFLLTFPVVFLIEALINPLDWIAVIGWTLGLAAIIWGGSLWATKRSLLKTLMVISGLTVAAILIDILFNGYCEMRAFLGYSAVAGARFYGIGNEYLGLLLGAYIVGVSLWLDLSNKNRISRFRSPILWSAVLVITILIIHPNLGAKIGGSITSLIGLGVTTCIWLGRPVRGKEIVGLLAALGIMLLLAGSWDFYCNRGLSTHFGQMIAVIKQNGLKTVTEMISRKWQLNLHLINYSVWTKVLIGVLLAIPVFYKKPPARVAQLFHDYPAVSGGFLGLTITATIGLLVNDSGIVTAATMYIFGLIMLLAVVFEEWHKQDHQNVPEAGKQ